MTPAFRGMRSETNKRQQADGLRGTARLRAPNGRLCGTNGGEATTRCALVYPFYMRASLRGTSGAHKCADLRRGVANGISNLLTKDFLKVNLFHEWLSLPA